MPISETYNCDCMKAMKELPDKYCDLLVADPPYGLEKAVHANSRIKKYGQLKTVNEIRPTKEWFEEVVRISKNQIIFGYNHLCDILPPTKDFIFWYKHQPVDTYSDGELAYTSFNKTAKCFDYPYIGYIGADPDCRISPAQKPIALYKWIYDKYLPNWGVVIDPFLGSGSSRIAAYDMGIDFIGYELDKRYFDLQEQRFARYTAQINLFID